MNELTVPIPPVKDRSVGLILFGVLTIGLGVVCSLFIPLLLFGNSMAAKSGQSMNTQVAPAAAIYGALAVVLIWLGVGSILKRRWARALLLIGSWSWLGMGVIALAFMAFMVRPMLATIQQASPQISGSTAWMVMLIPAGMMLVIFLILPAIWVFFYRSPHVKATCDYRDPVIRWTDGCPLPVLAGVLWMALSVIASVMIIAVGPAVVAVFGMFVVGLPAKLILAVTIPFWVYGTWAFYRLDPRGWWVAVVFTTVFMLSAIITYSTADITEIYPKLGYSPEQVAQMTKFNFAQGTAMAWMTVLWCVPVFSYLIYLRRFFKDAKIISGSPT